MGDQSCGKSSVLEALSGVQFPRGSGLVTRCPVQLIMKRSKPGESWQGESLRPAVLYGFCARHVSNGFVISRLEKDYLFNIRPRYAREGVVVVGLPEALTLGAQQTGGTKWPWVVDVRPTERYKNKAVFLIVPLTVDAVVCCV